MASKVQDILVSAISKVETLCPVTGFDFAELSSLIMSELKADGFTIAPLHLTEEMFAAGLAAHTASLPQSIIAMYNAEIDAWGVEGQGQ